MSLQIPVKINCPWVIFDHFDGETIIIDLKSGNYYCADKLASVIWWVIEKKGGFNNIVEIVAKTFNEPTEKIEHLMEGFKSVLLQENLIVEEEGISSDVYSLSNSEIETMIKESTPLFEPPTIHKYTDMQYMLKLDPIYDIDVRGWPKTKEDAASYD